MRGCVFPAFSFVAIALLFVSSSPASQLLLGTATADITPEGPVALRGQFRLRTSKSVETPLSADVVALESRDGDQPLDAAVMVACDLIAIDLRGPTGRRRHLPADGAGGPRRQLQRDRAEQPGRPRGRAGARG